MTETPTPPHPWPIPLGMGLLMVLLSLTGCAAPRKPIAKVIQTSPPSPVLAAAAPPLSPPAFPGAEGFGASAIGGRGGRVIAVTTLADRGPGSLRAALEAKGPRIVVFRVAGVIELQDDIRIQHPYLTVAGQTAPGGGILLKGTDNSLLRIRKGAHNIIVRYLRLRNGSGPANGKGHDNFTLNGGTTIIADHLSMSWSTDENAAMHRKPGTPPIQGVTIQRSIMAEGLAGHSNGMLISGTTDYSNPNRIIEEWRSIQDISIHHNLFIHNSHRNPRITSAGTQVINNVTYNWKSRIGSTTRGSVIDIIGNYAKGGPMSRLDRLWLHQDFSRDRPWEAYPAPSIYTAGNVVVPVHPDPAVDNWTLHKIHYLFNPLPQSYRRHTPLPSAPIPVRRQSAQAAYRSVVADVGANARLDCAGNWVPNADAVDTRLLADVTRNTGPKQPPRSPEDAGGYPQIAPGVPCRDQDQDGMPDQWEQGYGLDPTDPTDSALDKDGDGYTNIEAYLNGMK